MPILETFCQAIEQAIRAYETQVHPVPVHRQTEIQTLRTHLANAQHNHVDSMVLRAELIAYINALPAGRFAFIPLFDSRLRKQLQTVMTDARFSESALTLQERVQDRHTYTTQIDQMDTRITDLTQQLEEALAKDNVQKVNQLTGELAMEKQKNAFLTGENRRLEQSLDTTQTQLSQLQKNYSVLEAKYQALENEKSASTAASTQPTRGFFAEASF